MLCSRQWCACSARRCEVPGSGSTTFALTSNESDAALLKDKFLHHFGNFCWVQSGPLH
jgi:hypothetical protein